MKVGLLSQLAAAVLLVACSRSKNGENTELVSAARYAEYRPRAPAEQGPSASINLSTVEVRLDRTECYGWCPNYTVVISGNGHVQYIGRHYVTVIGEREANLPQDTVRELLRQFDAVKFVDLQDAYMEKVYDCPSTFLTLQIGGRTKQVENYWPQGAADLLKIEASVLKIHEQLDGLANAIDKAVRIEQWIGTLEEREALGRMSADGSPGRIESPK